MGHCADVLIRCETADDVPTVDLVTTAAFGPGRRRPHRSETWGPYFQARALSACPAGLAGALR